MTVDWKKDKVFRLCDNVGSGGTPNSSNPDYYDGAIRWVQTGDLNDGLLSQTAKTITEQGLESSSAKVYPAGTLLIAMYGATIGKMSILESSAATNQACCAMNFRKIMDTKYIFYKFIDIREPLIAQGYGGGQQNISQEIIKQTYIFFPRIEEQSLIAAYLDKTCAAIDTAVEKKQKQLETLDALRKSIIHKAVTRGLDDSVELKDSGVEWMGKLPKHWRVDKLKYVTSLIVDGTHVTPTYMPEGVPFLRVTDIQDEEIDLARVKYIAEEEHQVLCKRAKAEYGDILLSKNGTIGLVKIVHWDWEFSFFVSLCLLRPLKKLNPYYFSYYFESALVEQQLFESSKRTSVTNLHLVKIRELLIALPPVEEQKEIVLYLNEKLAHLSRLKLNIVAQIEALSNYRKSLIHECVTGKRRITEAHLKEIETHV